MRQRRAKNLEEKVEALASYQVENPQKFFGRWQEFFGNQNPIYLEIGCGKGQFALRQALAHPNRNYIAVEGQISVALRAMEKAALAEQQTGRRNLVIICAFVNDIGELFQEG